MSAQAATYDFIRGRGVGDGDGLNHVRIEVDYGDGAVELASAADLYPLSAHRQVGEVSPETLGTAVDVLADALATTDADRDGTGDARALKGAERFQRHYLATLPKAIDRSTLTRARLLEICGDLGI